MSEEKDVDSADAGQSLEKFKPGALVVRSIDRAVTARWPAAVERAARTPGASVDERIDAVIASFTRELSAAGAAAGAAAAVPGVGTAAVLGTAGADIAWMTVRTTDLILTIAALNGHTQPTIEERRAWVLSVLAFGNGAATGLKKLAGEVGRGLGAKGVKAIPTPALQSINRALGRTIVTKYGTKRGAIALGRAFPFGIGAILGGAGNGLMVRAVGRQTAKFFTEIEGPSVVDV